MTCTDSISIAPEEPVEAPAPGGPVAPVVPVLPLDDPAALDPAVVGAKAAALARATQAGLPVLPGFVITTGADWSANRAEIEDAWRAIGGPTRALVVRSSSTIEDGGSSSMAGMFTSVLDVVGWDSFDEAVHTVLGSAKALPDI
ncbi:MAG: PEP/pyruvate-binding domain-containing protein, partial [Acidimicrobiales bacterium]